MRTPGRDFELAVGLLLSEGVVRSANDIISVRHCESVQEGSEGNVVVMGIRQGAAVDLEPMKRGFHATSSCGVCGKASIEQVRREADPVDDPVSIPLDVLRDLPKKMRAQQAAFDATGGLHAAALFDGAGQLVCLREDVGRHNAVDKIVGFAALSGRWPLTDHVLLVSGRSSFEIVQKALQARIPVVAAVSAASSLAVELAQAGNQTLVGFLRDDRMVVYCGDERIRDGD
jgi:FdhD protein